MNEASRLIRALHHSRDGLVRAVATEAAVRLEVIVFVVALPIAGILAKTPLRFAALLAAVLFVLVVEILNTAIEKLADRVEPEIDPTIKYVKDLGSAAVTTSILVGVAIWLAVATEAFAGR